jgi:hypothetical protein
MSVQKIVVELHPLFVDPILPEDNPKREDNMALADSPGMAAAMSIPSLFYKGAFFPTLTSPPGGRKSTAMEKLMDGGHGESETLQERWRIADILLVKIGPYRLSDKYIGVTLEFYSGEAEVGSYEFIVQPDGLIRLITR